MSQPKIEVKKRCPECGSETFFCKIVRVGVCTVSSDGTSNIVNIIKEDDTKTATVVKCCSNPNCKRNNDGLTIDELISTSTCVKCGKEYNQEELDENGKCPMCLAYEREDLKDASKEDLIRMILNLERKGNGLDSHVNATINAKIEKSEAALTSIEDKKQKAEEATAVKEEVAQAPEKKDLSEAESKKNEILEKATAAATSKSTGRPRQKAKNKDAAIDTPPVNTETTATVSQVTPGTDQANPEVKVTPVDASANPVSSAIPVPSPAPSMEAPFPMVEDAPNPPAMNPYEEPAPAFEMYGTPETPQKFPNGAF